MKRVIVAYKEQITMEETLGEALEKIFGSGKNQLQMILLKQVLELVIPKVELMKVMLLNF